MMMPLTKRQREAKDWIARYIAANRGVSPSLTDLAQGLGVEFSSAQYLAKTLVKRGHATRIPGCWRTLQLIEDEWELRRRRRPNADNRHAGGAA